MGNTWELSISYPSFSVNLKMSEKHSLFIWNNALKQNVNFIVLIMKQTK